MRFIDQSFMRSNSWIVLLCFIAKVGIEWLPMLYIVSLPIHFLMGGEKPIETGAETKLA